jgi:hypothetical protein
MAKKEWIENSKFKVRRHSKNKCHSRSGGTKKCHQMPHGGRGLKSAKCRVFFVWG